MIYYLSGSITDVDYKYFITYAAKFYANMGNYLSYGYKKFIPDLDPDKFEQILQSSSTYDEINYTWKCIRDIIYDDSSSINTINLEEKGGKNSYYLGGIKEEQIKIVDNILSTKGISFLNTRLLMINPNKFVCLISSINEKKEELSENVIAYYGEFKAFLKRVNEYLEEARKVCSNETQKIMLQYYIESFQTGSIQKHQDSQREWLKDKQPVVDMNIGWLDTYIDPLGLRGYYTGWVALIDKEKSKKYNTLVANAEKIISSLPWSKDFEKPAFSSTDFNALDLICYASNTKLWGINAPHYLDIQENEGSKNISFSNALPLYQAEMIQFYNEKDIGLILLHGKLAIALHIANHELLGHGSGKLLRKNANGEFNFEKGLLLNPFTNEPIDK